ncbi:MAG: hypothetical protein C4547_14210 [Phycisphaerales bacterium]|nr:MAG: hypothetical protein C4547_14210 [Phycisphaerales bacterium]
MTGPRASWTDPRILASRAVLLEVMTILGSDMDKVVIVGGWVPELLYPGRGHIGSLDVDVALDGRRILPAAYDSIRRRLIQSHYVPVAPSAGIFYRDMPDGGIRVKLDLITGEGVLPREQESHAVIQDMVVGMLRGIDLALDHTVTITLTGALPDGTVNELRMRIASAAAFICMKAHALNERKREKDAYDVYFCLRHCDGGPTSLADTVRPLMGHPRMNEAIGILRSKFAAIDRVGPQWTAQVSRGLGEDVDQVARDAYERMARFLSSLG